MPANSVKVGDRALYIGKDTVFHNGEREGKIGIVVLDSNLEPGSNFRGGSCGWQVDGDCGIYITAIKDITRLSIQFRQPDTYSQYTSAIRRKTARMCESCLKGNHLKSCEKQKICPCVCQDPSFRRITA